jgi:hypothetical protein
LTARVLLLAGLAFAIAACGPFGGRAGTRILVSVWNRTSEPATLETGAVRALALPVVSAPAEAEVVSRAGEPPTEVGIEISPDGVARIGVDLPPDDLPCTGGG